MLKKVEDHPMEDVFGLEIFEGDVYYVIGKDVVSEMNIKRYLIERQQVQCYEAV